VCLRAVRLRLSPTTSFLGWARLCGAVDLISAIVTSIVCEAWTTNSESARFFQLEVPCQCCEVIQKEDIDKNSKLGKGGHSFISDISKFTVILSALFRTIKGFNQLCISAKNKIADEIRQRSRIEYQLCSIYLGRFYFYEFSGRRSTKV
jgi:hypothetical protein